MRRTIFNMFKSRLPAPSSLSSQHGFEHVRQALAASKKAVELANIFYRENLAAGCTYAQQRKTDEALNCFNNVISLFEENLQDYLKPLLANVYVQKGLALSKSGDAKTMTQGMQCIKRALELEPNNPLANETMDAILFDRGELPADRITPRQ